MSNYRRLKITGGTYFFTQVTYQRRPLLCNNTAREILRTAINQVRQKYPFSIEAIVLLPDHLHCIWTLPEPDSDYSTRWRLIKTYFTKNYSDQLDIETQLTTSRQKRKEGNIWQRRFWEHTIRDELDFARHCDYIHYNPVKHSLCKSPKDWQFSSFHRFVKQGIYPQNWGENEKPDIIDHLEFE